VAVWMDIGLTPGKDPLRSLENYNRALNNRLRYQFANLEFATTADIDINTLSASSATIGQLGSTGSITANYMTASSGNFTKLSASSAKLGYVSSTGTFALNVFSASSGTIGELGSTGSITANTLTASSANIKDLNITGSLTLTALTLSSAIIGQLGSTGSITANTLTASSANVGQLGSTGSATFNTLASSSGDFKYLHASSAVFGNSTSYSQFEADGTYIAVGDAIAWEDSNFNSVAAAIGVSAPDLINFNGTNIKIASLDGNATNEELSVSVENPHKYKEGTDIIPHVHWCPTSTDIGDVRLYLDYAIVSSTGIVITGTFDVLDSATGNAWVEKRKDLGTITGTDLKIGQQGLFRLYRIPASSGDTYGDDVGIFTFGYHHQVDTLGSRLITTK